MTNHYEIRIAGALDRRWATWFDGLTVATDGDGTTVIAGPDADQAALHGHLQRVRDLGIPLLSVVTIQPGSLRCPSCGTTRSPRASSTC
jgi:hypothetical protein